MRIAVVFSLIFALFFHLGASATPNCDSYLDGVELNEAQKKLAQYIQKDWLENVWDSNHHFYNAGIYSFLSNDPQAVTLLKSLGFQFDRSKRTTPFSYPENAWDFLTAAKKYLQDQEDKILPAITIQNVYTKEYRFITDVAELPVDAQNWTNIMNGLLDQDTYYEAIHKGFLPITVSAQSLHSLPLRLEDHEFQHLISLYHPDGFPGYMIQTKKMAALYVQKKVNSLTLFTFAEAFSFVRSDEQQKEKFESFFERWIDNYDSFAELKKQFDQMPLAHLEIMSKQFLELYPNLVLYRGGLIRDSILIPASLYPDYFVTEWKRSRSNKFSNEEFSLQNWRNLYIYAVLSHNLIFKRHVDPVISLSHMGWGWSKLTDKLNRHSQNPKNKVESYLRLALAELIWGIYQTYQLAMPAHELMKASIHKEDPNHEKAKKYFESVYGAVYDENEKQKSVYYRAFLKDESP